MQRPFRLARETLARARAAVAHLRGVDGAPQSLDALADRAINAEVDRLEGEHHGGRPFPVVEGALPRTPANMPEIAAQGREARARRRAEAVEQGDTEGDTT